MVLAPRPLNTTTSGWGGIYFGWEGNIKFDVNTKGSGCNWNETNLCQQLSWFLWLLWWACTCLQHFPPDKSIVSEQAPSCFIKTQLHYFVSCSLINSAEWYTFWGNILRNIWLILRSQIFKVVLECWKRCSEPFLIYIDGIQCDFMPKSCWKHSNFENRQIRYVNLAPDLRNHQKKPKKRITQLRFTQIFE